MAKYIRHFHLEDIAATRVHHHLVPGEGVIDFGACFRAIQAIKYDGWVTIELYPYIADPDLAFRKDPAGLWEELFRRARAITARTGPRDVLAALPTR